MVEIQTERFGAIVVEESAVIEMEAPILGFPESSAYALLPADEDSPFLWLQSVQEPELAFAGVNPFPFFPDYDFELPKADQEDLGLESWKHDGRSRLYCTTRSIRPSITCSRPRRGTRPLPESRRRAERRSKSRPRSRPFADRHGGPECSF